MKKITAIIITLALCMTSLLALVSCDGTPAETKAPETTASQGDATTAAEEQTTETEEQTTEAEEQTTEAEEQTTDAEATTEEEQTTEAEATTENSGGEVKYEEDFVALYQTRAADHSPVSAADGRELACRFSLNEGERLTGLVFESCPTWQAEGSAFIVELYKWDIDYDNTVLGEPLYTEEFTDWIDNAKCELDFTDKAEEGFPAGSYLWVFRGTVGTIGIWALDPTDGCQYFENGMEASNGFRVNAVVLIPA